MKSMGKMLLKNQEFSEIVIGNTALVRAMIESKTRVITSYPGSPMPETAEAIKSIKKEKRSFYFEFSTNEKVATEIAFGAAINGHLSTVFFKSVGLNVAADSFVQLPLMKIKGGMVVVVGDDPGANSSQNEQDNRHYAHLSYMPVFEPSDPQEVYEYYKIAAEQSQKREMPILLRLSTHVCHAKQKVHFKAFKKVNFDNSPKFSVRSDNYIPITSKVFPMKKRALKRLEIFKDYANQTNLNQLVDNGNKNRGVITAGLPYLSLRDVLEDVENPPDILKLGIVYPIPEKPIKKFLQAHKEIKILEELDDILEKEIKVIAFDNNIKIKIIGKQEVEDWVNEYTPYKVKKVMQKTWPKIIKLEPEVKKLMEVENRPAQLCPGCGHRSAFYVIKQVLSENDITVADIGCHTLGFLPPYEMGEVLLSMGHSTSTGTGLSLFNKERKVVSFLGDSTMFHAGLPGIVNAVYNDHNITLVIMENGTTAMTGHQNHPASGSNFNKKIKPVKIREILKGMGVTSIYEADTYAQSKLETIIKKAINEDGFSVVIASHPCMLKFTREARKNNTFKDNKVIIDQDICEQIHECVEEFGCPSFSIKENGEVDVNEDLCIGDGSCIQTCPVNAINIKRTEGGIK